MCLRPACMAVPPTLRMSACMWAPAAVRDERNAVSQTGSGSRPGRRWRNSVSLTTRMSACYVGSGRANGQRIVSRSALVGHGSANGMQRGTCRSSPLSHPVDGRGRRPGGVAHASLLTVSQNVNALLNPVRAAVSGSADRYSHAACGGTPTSGGHNGPADR